MKARIRRTYLIEIDQIYEVDLDLDEEEILRDEEGSVVGFTGALMDLDEQIIEGTLVSDLQHTIDYDDLTLQLLSAEPTEPDN